jgi:hypothetical protein
MSYKEKISLTILVVFFSVTYYISNKNNKNEEDSIRENKKETIGRVYKFESSRSFDYYDFDYYYNGIRYKNAKNARGMKTENRLNKFFRIEFSMKNPEYSKIHLDQEVTDSTEIVKAGFEYEPSYPKSSNE